jgi:hypothetical protein
MTDERSLTDWLSDEILSLDYAPSNPEKLLLYLVIEFRFLSYSAP